MAIAAGARTHLYDGAITPSRTSVEVEAFDGFPYALVVLDRRGRAVAVNREARRLVHAIGLSQTGLTCCSLLGCRDPDTVLAAGCVTEMALGHETVLPEVRVEIATDAGAVAMWVAAGTLGEDASRVVLQLRPGIVGDRRQRTDPHWMAGPRLRIHTLGRTTVEALEGPIGGAWIDQRTGQLLKYLVAERHRAVAVDEIGESIWPGAEYAVGTSVRYYVHALRRKLEPERGLREPSAFISAGAGTYRLKLDHVWVDAEAFERDITTGLAAAETDARAASAQIERGLAMYRGEFLADMPYAEWALAERHRLHELACTGLRCLADIRLQARMLDSAARALERLATLQPFDEDVHRRLMELDIARGRRSDAVRRYETLRARTRRTFGHDPDFTPADLARPRFHSSAHTLQER